MTAFVGAEGQRRNPAIKHLFQPGLDRLLDQFHAELLQRRGHFLEIDIAPCLVGIDDQARVRRADADGGNPQQIILAVELELEQRISLRRGLGGIDLHRFGIVE